MLYLCWALASVHHRVLVCNRHFFKVYLTRLTYSETEGAVVASNFPLTGARIALPPAELTNKANLLEIQSVERTLLVQASSPSGIPQDFLILVVSFFNILRFIPRIRDPLGKTTKDA